VYQPPINEFGRSSTIMRKESTRDRILLIEGTASWAKDLVPAFTRDGFSVVHLSRSPKNLYKIYIFSPDIVILDEDTTCSLVICHKFSDFGIPVIVIGEDITQEIKKKAIKEAGVDLYIKKPVCCEKLVEKVKTILQCNTKGKRSLAGRFINN
jgi:DNA-binding response OmpR family regulator